MVTAAGKESCLKQQEDHARAAAAAAVAALRGMITAIGRRQGELLQEKEEYNSNSSIANSSKLSSNSSGALPST